MKSDVTIFDYIDYQTYIKDVVAENVRKRGGEFGFRFFSAQLNWTGTYLNDIVTKRKRLSIPKAWELALFLKLNPLEREYLTFLCLRESPQESLQQYAESALKNWTSIKKYPMTGGKLTFHYNILTTFLESLVKILPPDDCTQAGILKKVKTLPIANQFSEADILFGLSMLVELNFLEKVDSLYRIKSGENKAYGEDLKQPDAPFMTRDLFIQYAASWKCFLEHRTQQHMHLKSSFAVLTIDQTRMIAKKIDEVRDMISDFDLENSSRPDLNTSQKHLMFQYNFNLLEIARQSSEV